MVLKDEALGQVMIQCHRREYQGARAWISANRRSLSVVVQKSRENCGTPYRSCNDIWFSDTVNRNRRFMVWHVNLDYKTVVPSPKDASLDNNP